MDDLIPNDGANYDPSAFQPEEQEKEEREYKAKAESSYPIINDLITKFEGWIKDADSLQGLGINSSMPQIQVQIISEGNTRFVEKCNEAVGELQAMADVARR